MKTLILTLTIATVLVGHVVYGLHKAKTEGHILEAAKIITQSVK